MFVVNNKTKLLFRFCPLVVHRTFQRNIYCTADSSQPSLRFIQFQRQNANTSRLGVVSEDGSNLIDLGAQGMFPHKLTHLLQSKFCIVELEKSLDKLKIEKVPDDVTILSPITAPDKILGIRPNQHASKMMEQEHDPPIIVSHLPNALTGPSGCIVLPRGVSEIKCCTELAIVIGKDAKHIKASEVLHYIFGYTIGLHLEVSGCDNLSLNYCAQRLIASSSDTFCPLGPTVVHQSIITDPGNLMTTLQVNNSPAQCDNTNDMIYPIPKLIQFITQYITLRPGDMIFTGPPSQTGHTQRCCWVTAVPGDTIECEIEGIGKIRKEVVADEE